jgi:hypothetical protein
MNYYPDKCLLLKIEANEKVIYKLFATWFGGHTVGQSWKLNSGVSKVSKGEDGCYVCEGFSGSTYYVHPATEGTSVWSQSVLEDLIESCKEMGVAINIIPMSYLEELINVELS